MGSMFWLLLFAFAVAAGWLFRRSLRQWEARKRAEEERFANFMARTAAAKPKAAVPEPALAIQLYGRLLTRYPATAFADQARAGVAALKKKLVKT